MDSWSLGHRVTVSDDCISQSVEKVYKSQERVNAATEGCERAGSLGLPSKKVKPID